MKKRIKSPYCPNCGNRLQPEDNFCPECGQENDNKRQSFGRVMSDLIQGFLSIDSRLAHSLPAILFRPGFLTKEYLNGRRQQYLDPVRMFITVVVIYFILASFGSENPVSVNDKSFSEIVDLAENQGTDTLVFKDGPFNIKVDNNIVTSSAGDTLIAGADELELDTPHYRQIKEMVKRGKTDTNEILDSLQIQNTAWNRFYYGEVIKFAGTDLEQFKTFLISKLPWIIFFLMPVFALLLKLIYIRKNFLYIDHLIFAFHLHSFFFITGILFLIMNKLIGFNLSGWLIFAVLIYLILAFKNFYLQSWRKTIFKIFTLFILYSVSTVFCFMQSLVVVFLLF